MRAIFNVRLLAATNRRDSIDLVLWKSGHFDWVNTRIPDVIGRLEILVIHTRKMRLDDDADWQKITAETSASVGSDPVPLYREAVMQQIREKMDLIDMDEDYIDAELLNLPDVTVENFCSLSIQAFSGS
jgi:transitional endoplasmic reticulum ATPase